MKKSLFLFVTAFLLLSSYTFSQRLYFCEEYRDSREIGVSDVFIIGSGGGYFTCMIDLRDAGKVVGTSKVSLKIYRVYSSSDDYISTEKFDVQPDWDYIFFDKFYTFYSEGDYKVVAYKSNGSKIATGYVTIKMRD
jgi:hypothetical protein